MDESGRVAGVRQYLAEQGEEGRVVI